MRFLSQPKNSLGGAGEFDRDFGLLLDSLAIQSGGLEEPGFNGVECSVTKYHWAADESGIADFSISAYHDSYNYGAADSTSFGDFRINGGSSANRFGIHQVRLRQHGWSVIAYGLSQ